MAEVDMAAALRRRGRAMCNAESNVPTYHITGAERDAILAALERAERLERAAQDAIEEYGLSPELVSIAAALEDGDGS